MFSIARNGFHTAYTIHPTYERAVLCTICDLLNGLIQKRAGIYSSPSSHPSFSSLILRAAAPGHSKYAGGRVGILGTIYVFPTKESANAIAAGR